MEPNRRVDAAVGAEYLAVLKRRVAEHEARVLIAERGGAPIGWAVFLIDEQPVYVVEEERRAAVVAELFVIEEARRTGVGKSLLLACEVEARAKGARALLVGVLAKNARARRVYLTAGYASYLEVIYKRL